MWRLKKEVKPLLPLPVLLVVVVLMLDDAGGGGGESGAGGGGGGELTLPPTWIPAALPEVLVTLITPLLVMPPLNEDWLTWIPKALGPLPLTPIVPVLLLMIPLVITEPPVTLIPPGVPPLALMWPLFEREPLMVELLTVTVAGAGVLGGPIVPVELLLTLPFTVALLKFQQSSVVLLVKKAKLPDIGLQAQALPPIPAISARAEVADKIARL